MLAKIEATKAGYEEAILLDSHGFVCEGTGENIFVVRDGAIVTPPQTAGILDGINRSRSSRSPRDLGYEVVERDLARAELYLADEVFLSGTAAELVPVREIDDHTIGSGQPGPITREIQRVFDDALHGRDPRYREWLDVVEVPSGQRRLSGRVHGTGHDRGSSCTTPPCATACRARGCRCRRGEKLRVAHRLDELGIDLIEAGFPSSNPKELELFELLARERFDHAADRRLRDDPPPRPGAPPTTRRCGCSPTASPRSARSSARPGRCIWRRSSRSTATRTCG